MPRRKRKNTHSMYSMSVSDATSVDDQPYSKIQLNENISKKKRIEPVEARRCAVVLNNIDENQVLQNSRAIDGGENITKIKMFQKCNSADEDSDKKVTENEVVQELRSADGDKNQRKTIQIVKTFTTVDTNNPRNIFELEIPRESQSGDKVKTFGMSNKMLRNCGTADKNNGKENEITTQKCGSGDGGKNRGTMIQMLQKFVNPTVYAENSKDNEMPRECQSDDADKNQGMMTNLLRNCNHPTVDALKNKMPQESVSVDEDENPGPTPKNGHVRKHSRSGVLRYRGSSTRGNFKNEADHDYCAFFDDYSSEEEYVPDLDFKILNKSKLKYEEDSNWSPPNKKSGKRKRARRSSTRGGKNRNERGQSEENDRDDPGHSNPFSDNSSKSSTDAAGNWNNKSEYGPKPNMSNFEKKKKKAQHLTNKSRSVHSKTFDLKTSIQPLLQNPTTIGTKSECASKPRLQYPTIETKSPCSPKPLLQHPTIETKSDNFVKPLTLQVKIEPNQETGEEFQDDDCVICFVGEKKTTPEATLPNGNSLLNKYVVHCKSYQSLNAEADSACMYCRNFVDLDAIKILAVADLLGNPIEYVESGIQYAEAEFKRLKKSVGKLLVEEQFKLKMVETKIKIFKKAMDLLSEFGSFEYYAIESEMFRLHNM